MKYANVKIESETLAHLKNVTGEKTGQKAVKKALIYFLTEARQRRISEILQSIHFRKGYDPLRLRSHER